MKKNLQYSGLFFATLLGISSRCYSQKAPESIRLTTPVTNSEVVEHALKYLTASNEIRVGSTQYIAGQSVTLVAGFEVKPGAIFEAFIEDVKNVSGEHSEMTSLSVYPNPVSNKATIDYFLPQSADVSVRIVNSEGVTLLYVVNKLKMEAGKHSEKLDIGNLPAGVYLCVLTTDIGVTSYKVIKQD